ncbi:hypothetical protein BDV10DRAFT_108863 [Aspergillus recurvatus]
MTGGRVAVQVLLSTHCYRLRMLIHFPSIARFLLPGAATSFASRTIDRLRQGMPQIVQDNSCPVWESCAIISALGSTNEVFIMTRFGNSSLIARGPAVASGDC